MDAARAGRSKAIIRAALRGRPKALPRLLDESGPLPPGLLTEAICAAASRGRAQAVGLLLSRGASTHKALRIAFSKRRSGVICAIAQTLSREEQVDVLIQATRASQWGVVRLLAGLVDWDATSRTRFLEQLSWAAESGPVRGAVAAVVRRWSPSSIIAREMEGGVVWSWTALVIALWPGSFDSWRSWLCRHLWTRRDIRGLPVEACQWMARHYLASPCRVEKFLRLAARRLTVESWASAVTQSAADRMKGAQGRNRTNEQKIRQWHADRVPPWAAALAIYSAADNSAARCLVEMMSPDGRACAASALFAAASREIACVESAHSALDAAAELPTRPATILWSIVRQHALLSARLCVTRAAAVGAIEGNEAEILYHDFGAGLPAPPRS